jgi:glycosyltransferase involved in cell wall biosynthesis
MLTSDAVPIHRLPISVDMDLYPEVPQRFGNLISILYSGSFDKKDGVTVLVDAFNRLASKRENVRLILTGVGADEDMRIVNQCVKNSPYKDRIIYKGYLNDADYYVALRDADILCMPRVDIGYAQAGFPFKLGEYLATGKPVIASTVSDIPMLLKDRQEAMLVTPGSSDAIVEAAEYLIINPVDAFIIGAKGRAMAKSLFDYHVHSKPLYEFLHGIVDQCSNAVQNKYN